jgi:hypothetical protein
MLVSLGIIILGVFGISNWQRDWRSLHWPATSGVIRSATLERSRLNGPGARQNYFRADILYDYQVAGVQYSGTRVSFGGLWRIYFNRSNEWQATRILNRYPEGKKVAVFYNPNDPAVAILEPKITDRTWTATAFSVAFLSWGGLPLIVFISRTSRDKNKTG